MKAFSSLAIFKYFRIEVRNVIDISGHILLVGIMLLIRKMSILGYA